MYVMCQVMPRQARLDAAGILHHVIIRGIERRKIFWGKADFEDFIDRLSTILAETKMLCYGWALMSNHAHFLFRTGDVGLSTVMRRLLTGYAVAFNKRHNRHGHLFQNRYKSIICQEDAYLKELVRYIHLNPLRAKLVSTLGELNRYEYSGHSVLLGRRKCEWQDVRYVLSYFGKRVGAARKGYLSYVRSGVDQGRRPELIGGGLIRSLGGWTEARRSRQKGKDRVKGDQRILGDSEFVLEVLEEANEKLERHYKLKSKGYDLKKVEQRVCQIYDVEPDDLYSRSRRKIRAEARSLFCYWCVRELGYALTDLAKHLNMTPAGVGYAVNKGERIARKEKHQLFE